MTRIVLKKETALGEGTRAAGTVLAHLHPTASPEDLERALAAGEPVTELQEGEEPGGKAVACLPPGVARRELENVFLNPGLWKTATDDPDPDPAQDDAKATGDDASTTEASQDDASATEPAETTEESSKPTRKRQPRPAAKS